LGRKSGFFFPGWTSSGGKFMPRKGGEKVLLVCQRNKSQGETLPLLRKEKRRLAREKTPFTRR